MSTETDTRATHKHEDEEKKGDLDVLVGYVRDNPILSIGVVVFVCMCVMVGSLLRVQAAINNRERTTQYARALEFDDPALRVDALNEFVAEANALEAEALYMQGESAYQAEDHATATEAFERLRAEFPEFAFVPDAVEGLGFVAEDQENYDDALARYEEVLSKWPNSFAGRRQQFNIARCQEGKGALPEAIEAYRQQLTLFPGSNMARRAQLALDRLRTDNPELFASELETGPEIEAPEEEKNIIDRALPKPVLTIENEETALKPLGSEMSAAEDERDVPNESDEPIKD